MRVGVDLGGTKIEVIVLDENGATLLRRRVPTPTRDYVGIVHAIVDLVLSVERELGRQGMVGVASPGAISTRTGLLKNSNSTALNGKPLDRDLSERLGRPVRLENDANCFALSEAVDGAAAGAHVVFGVVIGTGVGGGVVVGKQVLTGRNRITGEWGHNPLPLATRQRAVWRALLLRQVRLCRDFPVWCRFSAGSLQPQRYTSDSAGNRTCRRQWRRMCTGEHGCLSGSFGA
jgi:predicted NBD/HSP70 family sugar kinase